MVLMMRLMMVVSVLMVLLTMDLEMGMRRDGSQSHWFACDRSGYPLTGDPPCYHSYIYPNLALGTHAITRPIF